MACALDLKWKHRIGQVCREKILHTFHFSHYWCANVKPSRNYRANVMLNKMRKTRRKKNDTNKKKIEYVDIDHHTYVHIVFRIYVYVYSVNMFYFCMWGYVQYFFLLPLIIIDFSEPFESVTIHSHEISKWKERTQITSTSTIDQFQWY